MRKIIFSLPVLALAGLLLLASCKKKALEDLPIQQQEDLVILAMTSGQWRMSWFKENDVPVTAFDGYEFQYYRDYTVDAMKSGIITKGTWGGNSANMTTSAQFANTAADPLPRLNGTWNITRNSWTYVEAKQVSGGVTKTMRLDKK
jgi:hypothetical protein